MKLIHRLLVATIILIQSFSLCAQENPLHAYLPADAKTIITVNLPSLASKMTWQQLQQLSFFEEGLKDAPLHLQELLKDPSSSGINFHSELFIVMLPDPKNKTKGTTVLYGQLTDSAKFAATAKKIAPNEKINTAGKLRVLADAKHTIAWTSEIFVVPFAPKEKTVYPHPPLSSKSGKNVQNKKTFAGLAAYVIKQCQLLLTPVANPITNDSRFIDLTKESGDIRLWFNRNVEKPKEKGSKKDDVFKMMNWGIMQQGNYMASVIRFENGKAAMQMKSYMNKTLDSIYRLYPTASLNTGIFKKFPAGQPIALISFTMSPQMISAMMKASGTEKIIDSLTKKSSVKPMEIAEGLNGDITLAVIRAHEYDEKDTITAALNGLQLFLAASVKNKSKLDPLLKLLQKPKEPKLDSEGNEIKPAGPFGGLKPAFLLTDSFFVASISPLAAEKFLGSTGETDIAMIADPYASHASLFSFDLKAILNFAMQMDKKKKSGGQDASKMFDAFERVVIYGGKYENGAALTTAELQFTDKNENSLSQFIKMIEMAVNMGMKKSKPVYNEDESENEGVKDEEESERTKIDVVEDPVPPPPPKQEIKTKKKNN